MEIGKLTSKKPWAMLVFVLVAVNAIVALTAIMGVETPLDSLASGSIFDRIIVQDEQTTPNNDETNPYKINLTIANLLMLFLWVVILVGLSKAHAWSWWLLTFSAIIMLLMTAGSILAGTGLGMSLLTLFVNILIIVGLLHKETIRTFRPNLSVIKDGWSA